MALLRHEEYYVKHISPMVHEVHKMVYLPSGLTRDRCISTHGSVMEAAIAQTRIERRTRR